MLTAIKTTCYHCGDECNSIVEKDNKHFCCEGCKAVYEILNSNNLCTYYQLSVNPGSKSVNSARKERFAYLDDQHIYNKLITFKDKNSTHITLYIPQIHCSSCIWLLENLEKINKGVFSSRVDFLKKEVVIIYNHQLTSLRSIVEQLASIGYEPSITLESTEKHNVKKIDRKRIYRIGIAGFCFGNIMMFSFPEYLSGGAIDPGLKYFFTYLNLLLALPVFFFSSGEFFINAWKGLKQKSISIDVPISLGIIAMFSRSSYEIVTHTGAGFFDSMSGLVFFMLIGRKFQEFTFDSLAFDRDYKSYFPVAVEAIDNGKAIPVTGLKVNDRFIIRSHEIVPVDSILLNGVGVIDYSFVTGESEPVELQKGATIFSGGKHTGGIIELLAVKGLSGSRLTTLWNNHIYNKKESGFQKLVTKISKWFIVITIMTACSAALYWFPVNKARAMNAFTAVLVIACPCALALSAPFTYGNILRLLGKYKIYIKNGKAIEQLADIDTIVFDKTGTLTEKSSTVIYEGTTLTDEEKQLIYSLVRHSSHPVSQAIKRELASAASFNVTEFTESPGAGISGTVNGHSVAVGNSQFIVSLTHSKYSFLSGALAAIDGIVVGSFRLKSSLRTGSENLIENLRAKNYSLSVITGDNSDDKDKIKNLFGAVANLKFNQSPLDKLNYIKRLQDEGHNVLMIGDGLNDAGALLQSNAGISISDNANNFSPASDAIIDSSQFSNINKLLIYSKSAVRIIIWSFIISIIYNVIGLSYAVTGTLSPVIAAILMPISTISLVLFTVLTSTWKGKKLFART
jgi:Cu+-exporting ATPase